MTPTRQTFRLPSVDSLARHETMEALVARHGHSAVVSAIREVLEKHRSRSEGDPPGEDQLLREIAREIALRAAPVLRRVFNLTGTVLHTNLGRAIMSEEAVASVATAAREPCNLEFDLDTGARGERDSLVEDLLIQLTGAEAATVVNNNAAAVVLTLAALASGREVVVSRGELIEIGGSFRIPDIMRTAQVRLVEVGTTNRTHPSDYHAARGEDTAAFMKVHTSNYRLTGFVADVSTRELAKIAKAANVPLIVDLGAGSLIDLTRYGLPKEPVVGETVAAGADLVTFSGDKLLGGPQAGVVVGRGAYIDALNRHPLKRALRVSKITLAALDATLRAYRDPDRLLRTLPALRLLSRTLEELRTLAEGLRTPLASALGTEWDVSVAVVEAEVGSGSLPGEGISSVALAVGSTRGSGGALQNLAGRLRRLPVPVIGRISGNRLLLDVRCLEDEAGFLAQLPALNADS